MSFKTPKSIPEPPMSFKTPKPIPETPMSLKTVKPIPETPMSLKTVKPILNEKKPSLNTKSKSFTSYLKNIGSKVSAKVKPALSKIATHAKNLTAKVNPALSKIATHAKNLTAKVKPALTTPSKTHSKKSLSLNKQRENAVNWAIKNKLIEKAGPSPVSPPPPTSKSNIPPHVQKAINTIVHYISNVSNSKIDTIQSPFLAVQKQASSMAIK